MTTRCPYCRTENAFAEYHRHPSASSVLAASAKFSEIVNLPYQSQARQDRIIAGIRACPRHGNEVEQEAYAHWLVAQYECIRAAVEVKEA